MPQLLMVTLGPIQDLIAAARRSRDLWFGSWLLSELSKATALAMTQACGLDALIFPGVLESKELQPASPMSVANKIVIRVPDGQEPADVARQGEEGMRRRLRSLRDEAFDRIRGEHFHRQRAEQQVDDLIEFSWVSAPESGPKGYAAAREAAESLLAMRKNTRLWGSVPWGAAVPKSSIDGERESVLDEALFDEVKEKGLTPEDVRKRYGIRPTERLCGVGLLKRQGTRTRKGSDYAHHFLSTGHLAAWPIYDRTKKGSHPELEAAWAVYLEALQTGGIDLRDQEIVQGDGWNHLAVFNRYDGSLLFENRLAELFEEVGDLERRAAGLRSSKLALAEVLKRIGVSTPLPYYAILVADGDRMGKAIERQTTFEEHKRLSRQLDAFAQSVRGIVEKDHGGELIYAGGDDVLAFVPLHRVISCARTLAKEFAERLAEFPVDAAGNKPTLSAGIGISHFMDPMGGALRLARQAEQLAKKERNSLAVIVDKRSGARVEVVGPWGDLDQRLKDYVSLHRVDKFPDGAAYELRELGRLLVKAEGTDKANLEKLVKTEAIRILDRKQPRHGAEAAIDPKVMERLRGDINKLEVGQVANRLIVARLLAQAEDEATPPEAAPKTGDSR
jgi:CRISPR-associated protein Cmr2